MRLLIAGNLANHSYYLVKLLQKKGVDADLLTRQPPKQTEDPKFYESDLLEYPAWIRF